MSMIVIEGSNGVGKTTIIQNMEKKYQFISKKSVPDWYRKYIPLARSLSPDLQKQMYMIGHESTFFDCQDEYDYILDRFFYSTIIRLNYELQKSISDTVLELLDIPLKVDLLLYVTASKDIILDRLTHKKGVEFNESFFEYENDIFHQLKRKCDKIEMIDNTGSIDQTIQEMNDHLESHKILLKRRSGNER